jgi:hypothetical protein
MHATEARQIEVRRDATLAGLAKGPTLAHDIRMETRVDGPCFEEEQRFSLWMKAIPLVPVVVLGGPAILMWLEGPQSSALILTTLAVLFLLLAVPTFLLRLVTRLDSSHLHLRISPLWLPVPFVPPRIKDIPLDDVSHWEVRTYRPLRDSEYWGVHFWGLGSAVGEDRYIYVMKASPISGRGVQLRLRSGERLLVGSGRPEVLTDAIRLAKGESD